tara:strand:+ start:1914 stop:2294 length:381 start_codon:yes stop_codon:yes gene_type:complete
MTQSQHARAHAASAAWTPPSGINATQASGAFQATKEPAKHYGSLTDKIVDAAQLALENKDLAKIKFRVGADNTIALEEDVKPKTWSSVNSIIDELNDAIGKCVHERIAKNETAIRKILGGTRSRRR